MLPLPIDPMLAQPSRSVAPTAAEALTVLQGSGLWTFELKWDGARLIAVIDHGRVNLYSREGNKITYRYPEIRAALENAYPNSTIVLDGEVIVLGADGRPSYPRSHRRDAQANERAAAALVASMPAIFVVFDVLQIEDTDVRSWPYEERLALLAHEKGTAFATAPATLQHLPPSDDGATLWEFVLDQRLEGLVAKKKRHIYRSGRSHSWVKLKPIRSLSALVRAHRPGEAAGGTGALQLALLNEKNELTDIGHVGSGLTAAHMRQLQDLAARGFVVAEVEYMDVSPAGQLRQPVFKGFRLDVDLTDCNISQLEG